MKVHEATLYRAIQAGARTAEALRDATRAGMGCGTCRIDLTKLLDRVVDDDRSRCGA